MNLECRCKIEGVRHPVAHMHSSSGSRHSAGGRLVFAVVAVMAVMLVPAQVAGGWGAAPEHHVGFTVDEEWLLGDQFGEIDELESAWEEFNDMLDDHGVDHTTNFDFEMELQAYRTETPIGADSARTSSGVSHTTQAREVNLTERLIAAFSASTSADWQDGDEAFDIDMTGAIEVFLSMDSDELVQVTSDDRIVAIESQGEQLMDMWMRGTIDGMIEGDGDRVDFHDTTITYHIEDRYTDRGTEWRFEEPSNILNELRNTSTREVVWQCTSYGPTGRTIEPILGEPATWSSAPLNWSIVNYGAYDEAEWNVSRPGAQMMRLVFEDFDTERYYDDVTLAEPNSSYWDDLDTFSGNLGDFTTDWYATDTLEVTFDADGSYHRDGFRVVEVHWASDVPSEQRVHLVEDCGWIDVDIAHESVMRVQWSGLPYRDFGLTREAASETMTYRTSGRTHERVTPDFSFTFELRHGDQEVTLPDGTVVSPVAVTRAERVDSYGSSAGVEGLDLVQSPWSGVQLSMYDSWNDDTDIDADESVLYGYDPYDGGHDDPAFSEVMTALGQTDLFYDAEDELESFDDVASAAEDPVAALDEEELLPATLYDPATGATIGTQILTRADDNTTQTVIGPPSTSYPPSADQPTSAYLVGEEAATSEAAADALTDPAEIFDRRAASTSTSGLNLVLIGAGVFAVIVLAGLGAVVLVVQRRDTDPLPYGAPETHQSAPGMIGAVPHGSTWTPPPVGPPQGPPPAAYHPAGIGQPPTAPPPTHAHMGQPMVPNPWAAGTPSHAPPAPATTSYQPPQATAPVAPAAAIAPELNDLMAALTPSQPPAQPAPAAPPAWPVASASPAPAQPPTAPPVAMAVDLPTATTVAPPTATGAPAPAAAGHVPPSPTMASAPPITHPHAAVAPAPAANLDDLDLDDLFGPK